MEPSIYLAKLVSVILFYKGNTKTITVPSPDYFPVVIFLQNL